MYTDLRSDTVTKPSKEMKAFMLDAPVGDDVFQEDPTVNELEQYAADYFGMEAALYCSSGTQTNQIAINVHCRPGDEVICSKDAHIYFYEGGGIAKNSGSSVLLLPGDRGRITAKDVASGIKDPNNPHYPLTTLVSLEDTMNRGGGAIYDFEEIKAIRNVCKSYNLPLHLDGARVFNALIENNIPPKEYATQFDSISICLSKGLGAPVGSVLIGTKDFIHRARRARKVMGGGMRQAGIIAAGGLYALKNNITRLKEDHQNAQKLGTALLNIDWVEEVLPVQTNIVVAKLKTHVSVEELIAKCAKKDIHFMAFGEQTIRMVTHLDVNDDHIEYTIDILKNL
ncbi:threonine aldolase family protein [Brumimicrobium aurantiacum]|uniref:Aminotransferase class I/II-fold pyridoxal phosphate-dependent enzyme n=1 Tax=Brumimicrobium aurantiacum TaxID=1737063 RepID=A0A3E1EWR8_9FLAO|nr:GntG family PLP-dependent aldolase [Brumimicrobium aurantiacum]RFC53933.1 aminotransferase class I/II-fold pyridoxal phosphate-dependent enzyme [Brumimicrobium aurantiacum]